MDRIKECEDALIQALKNSETIKRFEKAKAAVLADEERHEAIDRFRGSVLKLQSSSQAGSDLLDEMRELSHMRQQARRDPLVAEYLDSELGTCRLLQEICLDVLSVTDLEIDSLKDLLKG